MKLFPHQEPRVETGTIQFGDDWPGVFLRGDEALYLAHLLELVIEGHEIDPITRLQMSSYAQVLNSCWAGNESNKT